MECADGTKYIVCDGFIYTRTLQYNSKDGWYSNWRCALYRECNCKAKAVTKSSNPNLVELNQIPHSHGIENYRDVLTIETDILVPSNEQPLKGSRNGGFN